jgi:hypothetical protein
MIYKSCSIEEVIARIIRNTRISDASFIIDMNEWIPEAMGMMKTQYQYSPAFKDIEINFHKGKLPCDLVSLLAVEYEGCRLNYSSTVKHYKTGPAINKEVPTVPVFVSETVAQSHTYTEEETPETKGNPVTHNNIVWKASVEGLKAALALPLSSHWYQTEMDWLNTSICDGTVRLYYYAIPVDDNGLPLIPDNEDYKQALYYYVRAMMVGAGYDDKTFKYEQLLQHFELHAARAIGQIRYPSLDMKEQQIKTQVRFIPPANYSENYFSVASPEGNFLQ